MRFKLDENLGRMVTGQLRMAGFQRHRRDSAPARPTPNNIAAAIASLMQAAAHASVLGKLWIVQAGRVRQYEPEQ